MRCKFCDYSPTAKSDFYSGLYQEHSPNIHLKEDKREGGFVCSVCYGAIGDDLRETMLDDELDFNAPTMSMWEEQ